MLVFVSHARLDDWLEDVPAAPHRFVLRVGRTRPGLGEPPAEYRDYLAEVRGYPGLGIYLEHMVACGKNIEVAAVVADHVATKRAAAVVYRYGTIGRIIHQRA